MEGSTPVFSLFLRKFDLPESGYKGVRNGGVSSAGSYSQQAESPTGEDTELVLFCSAFPDRCDECSQALECIRFQYGWTI